MTTPFTTGRVITGAIGLIVTPVAVALVVAGGDHFTRLYSSFGGAPTLAQSVGPTLMFVVGVLLLVGVVVTGLWSSAGLLAAGVTGLLPLAAVIFPALTIWIWGVLPGSEIFANGMVSGQPLIIPAVLGAMGLALLLVRRLPLRTNVTPSILGYLIAPVALTLSAWLMTVGLAIGPMRALQTFRLDSDPVAILTILGALVLLIGGIVVVRWSPAALVAPAVALLIVATFGADRERLGSAVASLPDDHVRTAAALVITGTALIVALLYLAFTVVVLVRRRIRLRGAGVSAAEPSSVPSPKWEPDPTP